MRNVDVLPQHQREKSQRPSVSAFARVLLPVSSLLALPSVTAIPRAKQRGDQSALSADANLPSSPGQFVGPTGLQTAF